MRDKHSCPKCSNPLKMTYFRMGTKWEKLQRIFFCVGCSEAFVITKKLVGETQ